MGRVVTFLGVRKAGVESCWVALGQSPPLAEPVPPLWRERWEIRVFKGPSRPSIPPPPQFSFCLITVNLVLLST